MKKSGQTVYLFYHMDGGPDENPRYQRVADLVINHFLKHSLDALFSATNAMP